MKTQDSVHPAQEKTLIQVIKSMPPDMKNEVADFVDFLMHKYKRKVESKGNKRVAGKAKGLISMNDNFDDPIEGFEEYMP